MGRSGVRWAIDGWVGRWGRGDIVWESMIDSRASETKDKDLGLADGEDVLCVTW